MQVALSYQTWQELKEVLQQKVMEGLQSMETATDYFSVLTPFSLKPLKTHTHTCAHLLPFPTLLCMYVLSLYIKYA